MFVESERRCNGAPDLRNLERMRQPGPVMIALVIDEYLGLVDEAAKRRRVNDPVTVTLKRAAIRMF